MFSIVLHSQLTSFVVVVYTWHRRKLNIIQVLIPVCAGSLITDLCFSANEADMPPNDQLSISGL